MGMLVSDALIAVLVPTVNRAHMLPGLVDNIRAVTRRAHRIYLIMEDDDEDSIKEAATLDVVPVIGQYGSCARAMNAGYEASTEPFVQIANDDCIFHEGWDNAAMFMDDRHHIVGVDDGKGDMKCFSLVRRKFIEEHSGVFDKPNTLFHTYRSQGSDTEFSFYAMLREVWAPAHGCVVEHADWRSGRADADHPNYLKARRTIQADLAEYHERWPLWDPRRVMPPPVATVTPI